MVVDRVYLADRPGGLLVIKIDDPLHPEVLGQCATPGDLHRVAVAGARVFGAGGVAGLRVFDVSVPGMPTLIGTLDTPGEAQDVALAGDLAYVADALAGLQIVDIADPTAPRLVGSVAMPLQAVDVWVSGATVYAVQTRSGLQAVDATRADAPRLLGSAVTGDTSMGVAVRGGDVLVADGAAGLRIFTAQCGEAAASPLPGPGQAAPIVHPNPASGRVSISFVTGRRGPAQVEVYDLAGHRMCLLSQGELGIGPHSAFWDGRDADGRAAPAGVYLIRVAGAERTAAARMVKLR